MCLYRKRRTDYTGPEDSEFKNPAVGAGKRTFGQTKTCSNKSIQVNFAAVDVFGEFAFTIHYTANQNRPNQVNQSLESTE